MFTGIITHTGTIAAAENRGDLRISIACDFTPGLGESVAVNGVCLTAVAPEKNRFNADLSAETLSRTAPSMWQEGRRVNLERALKFGDTLDGHLVSGHVDGLAVLTHIIPSGDSHILSFEAPVALSRFITEKGSVTLDGISLTVNRVEHHRFWVNIIPHTWGATTLSSLKEGEPVNLEIDLIARYVERLLQK